MPLPIAKVLKCRYCEAAAVVCLLDFRKSALCLSCFAEDEAMAELLVPENDRVN